MIKQAIIPLAGLGTRLLPLTSVFAKELLPINGKPGIEYIIDECIEAGIKEIIFIISRKKMMIKKYFYNDSFYKKIIKKKKDKRIIKEYKKILKYKKMIKFVYQDKPLGTGNAVLKAQKLIKNDFFLMLLPDDLIIKKIVLNQ
jgi:UTP--glucose-1-phosphate uridylyltransferase